MIHHSSPNAPKLAPLPERTPEQEKTWQAMNELEQIMRNWNKAKNNG